MRNPNIIFKRMVAVIDFNVTGVKTDLDTIRAKTISVRVRIVHADLMI